MPAALTIELKNIRLFGNHGWYDEEALLGNEFELTLLATLPAVENIHSIEETVDYTKIYAIMRTTFAQRERLLETLAQKIVAEIKKAFPEINHINLSITKLNPLIENFMGTVGISYSEDFK